MLKKARRQLTGETVPSSSNPMSFSSHLLIDIRSLSVKLQNKCLNKCYTYHDTGPGRVTKHGFWRTIDALDVGCTSSVALTCVSTDKSSVARQIKKKGEDGRRR